jgi:hypothetical protein
MACIRLNKGVAMAQPENPAAIILLVFGAACSIFAMVSGPEWIRVIGKVGLVLNALCWLRLVGVL